MTSASSILKSFAAISFFFRGWRPSVRGVLSVSRKGWIIVAATILVVVLLAAFMSNSRGELPVRAERAVRQTIINTIQTNGKIEPVQNFEAHAPAATTVKKLLVLEGDHVKQGQLLLQLDDADARAQAAKAQAELNLANQQLKSRYSSAEVQRVVAQHAEAQAAYHAARELLQDSNVRAPRAGVVYSLPVRQGQFVNTGDLLVQVADLAKVQVRAFVDEPDIGRLARGQQVTVAWDAISGRQWQGAVTRIPTTVSVMGTRTVGTVTCEVDNRDGQLLPNINVNVTVMTAKDDNALTVSREAMHQEDRTHFVYEIVDGMLKRRDVETSVSNLTRIEVTKGLKDGAQVALGSTNNLPLKADIRVQVVER